MKRIAQVIIVLLLFSTVGIKITNHYCGEILKNTSLFIDPHACCNEDEMPADCCHNEQHVVQLVEDLLKEDIANYDLSSKYEFTALEYTFLQSIYFQNNSITYSSIHQYSPPLLRNDIQLEVQSFLL